LCRRIGSVFRLGPDEFDFFLSGCLLQVRTQDVVFIFGSIAVGSAAGRALSWEYLKTNFAAISVRTARAPSDASFQHPLTSSAFTLPFAHAQKRFEAAGFLIPRICGAAAGGWTDHAKADEIEKFFVANPCPPAERGIKQALEGVRAHANRLAREEPQFVKHFANAK
jgi:hypothetical protein